MGFYISLSFVALNNICLLTMTLSLCSTTYLHKLVRLLTHLFLLPLLPSVYCVYVKFSKIPFFIMLLSNSKYQYPFCFNENHECDYLIIYIQIFILGINSNLMEVQRQREKSFISHLSGTKILIFLEISSVTLTNTIKNNRNKRRMILLLQSFKQRGFTIFKIRI